LELKTGRRGLKFSFPLQRNSLSLSNFRTNVSLPLARLPVFPFPAPLHWRSVSSVRNHLPPSLSLSLPLARSPVVIDPLGGRLLSRWSATLHRAILHRRSIFSADLAADLSPSALSLSVSRGNFFHCPF
jgi:hypothetical protein